MSQESGIPILQSLSSVYPGIEGELENRHTNLYSLVSESFRKTYETSPELYVCVNRTIKVIQPRNMGISLAMSCENGLIIALSRTYKDSSIFVNGKGLEEEMEFSCKGDILKNKEAEHSSLIKEAIEMGIEDCSLNALHGGILYFHSQLPKYDKKGTLFAFTLATILINQMQGEYTLRQIQLKVSKALNTQLYKQQCLVNKMLIRNSALEEWSHLDFEPQNTKFVIGDLLILEEEGKRIKAVQEKLGLEMQCLEAMICKALDQKTMSLSKLQEVLKVDTAKFQEICEKHIQESYSNDEIKEVISKDITEINDFSPKKRLELFFKELHGFQSFLSSPTQQALNKTFRSILDTQRSLGYISQRMESVIGECLSEYGSSCCLVENRYLAIVTTKQKFIWLFELFKKNVFMKSSGEAVVEGNVQHLLFSTGPATGVAVLDLSNQMWY